MQPQPSILGLSSQFSPDAHRCLWSSASQPTLPTKSAWGALTPAHVFGPHRTPGLSNQKLEWGEARVSGWSLCRTDVRVRVRTGQGGSAILESQPGTS